jgi:phosphatidylserine decarboxylase
LSTAAALAAGGALALASTLPLAWKWELGLPRVAVGVALLAAGAAVLVALLDAGLGLPSALEAALVWALAVGGATAVLAYRFYRDPERTPPGAEVVVSPADGEVVYVREAREGVVPVATKHGRDYTLEELTRTELRSGDAVVVGIAMSFLDVHVNRAPIAGRVTLRRHFPGLFGSLKDPEMALRNERATTVIEGGGLQVAVVQIASRLVRQIASYVAEGEEVGLGQRIGVIRLGSQVDLVLPAGPGLDVRVRRGDHVRAGESVVATLSLRALQAAGERRGAGAGAR